jgi:hypothetical protein
MTLKQIVARQALKIWGIGYMTGMSLLLQMNWFCAWLNDAKVCRVYINNFNEAWPEFFLTIVTTGLALAGAILIVIDITNERECGKLK